MSIAENQLLNIVLETKDYSPLADNNVTDEYFVANREEYWFITSFYEKYGCIPDKESFTSQFPKYEYFKVSQSIKSIVDTLREEMLFRRAVTLLNESSGIFEKDSRKGAEFLLENMDKLRIEDDFDAVDIIHNTSRYDEWEEKKKNPEKSFIPLPFPEMKDTLFGFAKGEELFIWLAKSGVGKSQILALCTEAASRNGYRVGVISPELSSSTFGYRFDSARSHLSNSAMSRGLLMNGYGEYIKQLSTSDEHVFIADSTHFHGEITVQTCENFILAKRLDILLVDDVSYITVPNATRMQTTERIGRVCRGLFNISAKHGIPVVATIQARRRSSGESKDGDDVLDSESIFNSYMVTQQSTRIVSINRCGEGLKFYVAKNRYGSTGKDFVYSLDMDKMHFTYCPSEEDVEEDEELQEVKEGLRHAF